MPPPLAPRTPRTPTPPLTLEVLTEHVHDHVFGTASSAAISTELARRSVGIELEWLTSYRRQDERVSLEQLAALIADLGPLPRGGRLTIEPGGQLELSSARFDTLDDALHGTATDLFVVDRACAERRIDLVALGTDPIRPPSRVLEAPRYDAMEQFFDADGRAGRMMMCNTASIQVNLGLGAADEVADRWRLANALGPTLIACFANSPFHEGHPTGWQSSRLQAWWHLDPTRATPPCFERSPEECWLDYALDARVMLIRSADGASHPITGRLTFGQWMVEGHELGWPTLDDFRYHLTTLFPPVRPRGWFEVRYIDALPTPFWQVATAVLHTLLDHPETRARTWAAIAGTTDLWIDAAQLGLAEPRLARASRDVFLVALDALESLDAGDADDGTTDLVRGYFDRRVARQRTPADDRLEAWRQDGTLLPRRESPVPYVHELIPERGAR